VSLSQHMQVEKFTFKA